MQHLQTCQRKNNDCNPCKVPNPKPRAQKISSKIAKVRNTVDSVDLMLYNKNIALYNQPFMLFTLFVFPNVLQSCCQHLKTRLNKFSSRILQLKISLNVSLHMRTQQSHLTNISSKFGNFAEKSIVVANEISNTTDCHCQCNRHCLRPQNPSENPS